MSYITWQEPANPFVVELISPGTEKEDLGQILHEVGKPLPKGKVYEQTLRIPYYIVYDRCSDQLLDGSTAGLGRRARVIKES